VEPLVTQERPADGDPAGLLILHHGRGTDELDLLPLADVLDPERRLHVVTPRGPLTLPNWPGFHWYAVPRVGHPDPPSFQDSYRRLSRLHDELWERTGIGAARTVLGGFSMGAVMSYSTGLGPGRPRPAAILAFSGFIPTVADWQPSLEDRPELPVFISHGLGDPVIPIDFAHRARDLLTGAGLPVEYHEFGGAHEIAVGALRAAISWLSRVV
jgi:phospholipase/carboxylesterase